MTTPSRVSAFSADEDAFVRDFTEYVAGFGIVVESEGADSVLRIPGYRPVPWPKVERRKRLALKRPSADLYEEAATAAVTYFFDRMRVSTFYDVGAYFRGYFTRLALCYQAYPIDIYAFEMRPDYHAKLAAGVDAVGRDGRHVELMLAGLSDHHVGEKDMWYSRALMFETKPALSEYREPWWTRLKFALRGVHGRETLHHARIEITSIDHFSAARNLVPDVIKIDVEGYEGKVLQGAKTVLARHRPVVLLELHRQKWLHRFGMTRRDVLRPLFEIGYRAILITNHQDKASAIVPVTADSAEIDRDETNMVVLY